MNLAKRKLLLTLEVVVEDLNDEVRKDLFDAMQFGDLEEDLPTASEFDPVEYAYVFTDAINFGSEYVEMMFEGSDVYGTFTSAELKSAEWVGEWEGENPPTKY